MKMNVLDPKNWLDKYADYFVSLAMLKVANRALAEDIVQDTFLSALTHIANFRGEASEKTWLLSILNNKIIDSYRKKDVLKNSTDYLTQTSDSFYSNFFNKETFNEAHWKIEKAPNDWLPEQEAKMNSTEFFAIFSLCLKKIPEKLRVIFIAKYIDELDAKEICKENEISSSNYWVMIHRSKLLMRECLDKNWFNV
ncbi:MAG: sigma-70 family RNA polymerase sigma factor [Bacteroidota bacterium]